MPDYSQVLRDEERLYRRLKRDMDQLRNISSISARNGVTAGTQSIAYMQRQLLVQFQQQTMQNINRAAYLGLTEAVQEGITRSGNASAAGLNAFIDNAYRRATRKQGLARKHQVLADRARSRAIESFQTTRAGSTPSYRNGKQRLPGMIMKALNSDGLFRATRDGVIINESQAQRVAAHWNRLNYGAGRRGKRRSPTAFLLRDNGKAVGGSFRMPGKSGDPFSMPAGMFLRDGKPIAFDGSHARGQDPFFLLKHLPDNVKAKYKPTDLTKRYARQGSPFTKRGNTRGRTGIPTQGIAGYHFMDAAAGYLASNMPTVWRLAGEEWLREASVPTVVQAKAEV